MLLASEIEDTPGHCSSWNMGKLKLNNVEGSNEPNVSGTGGKDLISCLTCG